MSLIRKGPAPIIADGWDFDVFMKFRLNDVLLKDTDLPHTSNINCFFEPDWQFMQSCCTEK
ncbi:MAG: hypothetical protein DI539_10770 [Flavobacterium psychrophilum]|nr:MAG: hypothetical protein DI539_10770 [Flavobacterium psychrophilum]